MEVVKDKRTNAYAKEYVLKNDILNMESVPVSVHRFAKGEFISTPNRKNNHLYIVIKGHVKIYLINDEADIIPVNEVSKGAAIGDIEFCKDDVVNTYAEARTDVECIAINVERYRSELKQDCLFLQFLLSSICEKVYMNLEGDTPAVSVEDKVLLYMRNQCKNRELTGVESAALKVRCSRRQLQRVLKKLLEAGRIIKIGKGKYILQDRS